MVGFLERERGVACGVAAGDGAAMLKVVAGRLRLAAFSEPELDASARVQQAVFFTRRRAIDLEAFSSSDAVVCTMSVSLQGSCTPK
jgi:DNA-binding IclR family transcriptional regulator